MKYLCICAALLAALLMSSCNARGAFDGDSAYSLLVRQTDIGDRSPGKPGARKCVALIKGEMAKYCAKVYEDRFTARAEGKSLKLTNIVAVQNPEARTWIMLCSHWDNRPFSDQAKGKDALRYCPGANDGASSCAALMEIARQLATKKPSVGVIYVFFDGEDYGHTEEGMYLGSTWFSRHTDRHFVWKGEKKQVRYAILLDMVGDKDLQIYRESLSNVYAPRVVSAVWDNARSLGYGEYFADRVKYAVHDDHLPLNEIARVPSVDVIDFDYPYWHTPEDTADKCSPESLKRVGDVILQTVYDEKP